MLHVDSGKYCGGKGDTVYKVLLPARLSRDRRYSQTQDEDLGLHTFCTYTSQVVLINTLLTVVNNKDRILHVGPNLLHTKCFPIHPFT